MTTAQIISAAKALQDLNSWCRRPWEERREFDRADTAIYHLKSRVIAHAVQAGLTNVQVVAVERQCKTCDPKAPGMFKRYSRYDYDGDDWDYEDCRRCNGTGRVTLRFAETNIGGVRWHTPRPKAEFLKLPASAWETPAPTSWEPEQPGYPLGRKQLIKLLNEAEREVLNGKLIDQACIYRPWVLNPLTYRLHLGTFPCFVCGYAPLDDKYHSEAVCWDVHRPGLDWRQWVCWGCSDKAQRWPMAWPNYFKRASWYRESDYSPHCALRIPMPATAEDPIVTEWLARRGIVIGAPHPGEIYFSQGMHFVEVVAVKNDVAYCKDYDSDSPFYRYDPDGSLPLIKVPTVALRGWPVKQIVAAEEKL